jgi:CHAD domain-containing protein
MAERSFGAAIVRVVRKRLRVVLEDGPAAVKHGRASELHELRIAVKRLRYNLEFAAWLDAGATRPALDQLALLQERLGALADADTFGRTYAAMLDALERDDPRYPGLSNLVETAHRERGAALEAIRVLWTPADAEPYPDRLAASISAALGSVSPKPLP